MLPFVLRDGREVIVVMHHDLPEVLERLFRAGGRPPVGMVEKLLKKYIDEHLGPVDPFADDDDEEEDEDSPIARQPVVHDLVRQILDRREQRKRQLEQARRQRKKRFPRCPRCQACPCARGVPHDRIPADASAECPTCRERRLANDDATPATRRQAASEPLPAETVPAATVAVENGPDPRSQKSVETVAVENGAAPASHAVVRTRDGHDLNEDVGSARPLVADAPPSGGGGASRSESPRREPRGVPRCGAPPPPAAIDGRSGAPSRETRSRSDPDAASGPVAESPAARGDPA